jgi:hypothetical protein
MCFYFVIIFCLFSCGGTKLIKITKDQINIIPSEKKIQLKVGLLLSQDFRTIKRPMNAIGVYLGEVDLGEGLSSGAEKMARDLFQEVIILDTNGSSQSSINANYDVILMPEFDEFVFRWVKGTIKAYFITQNIIKWDISSPDGKIIYQNSIKSDEIKVPYIQKMNDKIVIETLIDQFQKAQQDIYSSGWWKNTWWKNSN